MLFISRGTNIGVVYAISVGTLVVDDYAGHVKNEGNGFSLNASSVSCYFPNMYQVTDNLFDYKT